jgi:hypothetical protein
MSREEGRDRRWQSDIEGGNQFVVVSGILAGFAVSAIAQFVGVRDKTVVVTLTLISLLASASFLLASMCAMVWIQFHRVGLTDEKDPEKWSKRFEQLRALSTPAAIAFLLGLLCFLGE